MPRCTTFACLALYLAAPSVVGQEPVAALPQPPAAMQDKLREETVAMLPNVVKDRARPRRNQLRELCRDALDAFHALSGDLKTEYEKLAAPLLTSGANEVDLLLLQGIYAILYAWDARGTVYVKDVP